MEEIGSALERKMLNYASRRKILICKLPNSQNEVEREVSRGVIPSCEVCKVKSDYCCAVAMALSKALTTHSS